MLALTAATRIYLYRSPCDMRKSFDGLCGLIRSELRADPLSGSLFVFCNRRQSPCLANDFFNHFDDSARGFPVPQVWRPTLLAIAFEDLANFVFHLINLYQLV